MLRVMPLRMPPPPIDDSPPARRSTPPQTPAQWEVVAAALIFSGLVVVLGLASAVLVQPSLAQDFNPYWPALAGLGLLYEGLFINVISTVAGSWWLWWRPR